MPVFLIPWLLAGGAGVGLGAWFFGSSDAPETQGERTSSRHWWGLILLGLGLGGIWLWRHK